MTEQKQEQKPDPHPIISSFELKDKLMAEGEIRPLVNIMSRFPSLDYAIENFHDGELIAVSGYTKHGKTTFCQTLTKNFAEQQYFSLWFSYEVTPRQFLNSFDDADLPLFFVPDGLVARSMEWVEKKILESLKKYNTRIVFVDHLHYLFDMVSKQNISLTIGTVVRALKRIAVNNKIIIFLLCHTGKPITDGGELNHGAIRDSSFVAQESDCVILVSRTGNNEGQIKVEFHRRTGCFQRVVPIVKIGKYFQEMTREEEGDYSEGYKKEGGKRWQS